MKNTTTLNLKAKPNYGLLSTMCYVAIVIEIISAALLVINAIPEWLVVCCRGFLWIYLLIGLRKHYMIFHENKPIPFIALITLSIFSYISILIMPFIPGYDEEFTGLRTTLINPFVIPMLMVMIFVASKLWNNLENASIGMWMTFYALSPFFALFIALFMLTIIMLLNKLFFGKYNEVDILRLWYVGMMFIIIRYYYELGKFFSTCEKKTENYTKTIYQTENTIEQNPQQEKTTKYCTNCGKEISKNAKFCSHCGVSTEKNI
ncbi:MAG: zinc ribbon domain-containing protein [Flavobacteriaceae bacterium]|jgi:hypothetical protein|nr:zinc ribbon domain-containing protein [Flavobacteriaceae bacterium]